MLTYGNCTISNRNGKKVEAEVIRLNNSGVWLKFKDGTITRRRLKKLNETDNERLQYKLTAQNIRMKGQFHV